MHNPTQREFEPETQVAVSIPKKMLRIKMAALEQMANRFAKERGVMVSNEAPVNKKESTTVIFRFFKDRRTQNVPVEFDRRKRK